MSPQASALQGTPTILPTRRKLVDAVVGNLDTWTPEEPPPTPFTIEEQQPDPQANQPATIAADIADLESIALQLGKQLDRLKSRIAQLKKHHADTIARLQ